MDSGIYKIFCQKSGKSYVGQAQDFTVRWTGHKKAFKGNRNSRYLQNAWKRYGAEAFEFSILERCDLGKLDERETYWIQELGTFAPGGYNLTPGGGSNRGLRMSDKTRRQMSASAKRWARKPAVRQKTSQVTKQRLAAGNFGKATWTIGPDIAKRTGSLKRYYAEHPEKAAKLAIQLRELWTPELRARQSEWARARIAAGKFGAGSITPESRARMSASAKRRHEEGRSSMGVLATPETRKKQSEAALRRWARERAARPPVLPRERVSRKGVKKSPETIEKMRLAANRRTEDPEWRRRHSECMKAKHADDHSLRDKMTAGRAASKKRKNEDNGNG